jgi:FHA domain-containing protein
MDHASSILHRQDELAPEWALNADSEDDVLLGLFADNAVPLTSTLDDGAAFDPTLAMWSAAPDSHSTMPPQTAAVVAEAEAKPQMSTQHEERARAEQIRAAEHFSLNDVSDQESELSGSGLAEYAEEKAGDSSVSLTRLGVDPVRHQPFKPAKSASKEQLHGELFSAFVAGLGLDDAVLQPDFSPEQLYLAGKLLSLFSQGTVALLSSRSILKRGLKAEMTMILEEENNPFKMLPSGKTVLLQMFSTPMPGFITPENAVRDAMIDLQAHQLGMIAGVRAIIAAMLQTFHPDNLEKMAAEQGTLPGKGVFSGNRKAALWDTLKTQYQRVANEVEDDFHTLFGEAFLHAYDLEVRQYKASQNQKAP